MTGWISFVMPERYKRVVFVVENHDVMMKIGGFTPNPPMNDLEYRLLIEAIHQVYPIGTARIWSSQEATQAITTILKQWLEDRHNSSVKQAYKEAHKLC